MQHYRIEDFLSDYRRPDYINTFIFQYQNTSSYQVNIVIYVNFTYNNIEYRSDIQRKRQNPKHTQEGTHVNKKKRKETKRRLKGLGKSPHNFVKFAKDNINQFS